ncbi:MAG: hypothetical protein ACTSRS_06895 [Candidatus Helarchaeota archaeon]
MVLEYLLNDKTCKIIRCLIGRKNISAYKISKLTNISYERTLFWLQKLKNARFIIEKKKTNGSCLSLNETNLVVQNLIRTFELDRLLFTNDFIFIINELNKLAEKEPFEFLIGEPIDINYWTNSQYTNYPLEVFVTEKKKCLLKYNCIDLIECDDNALFKQGEKVEYFGISFKILSLEYSLISNLKKISNPRIALEVLAFLDHPLNWDLIYSLVKKEKLENRLGYFLELKELFNRETEKITPPKIPAFLLDQLKFKKKKKKFRSKFFLINNRLERADPYCILGRQWGIQIPLTKNEIFDRFYR